jgi:small subunit ribosomal protein S15
MAVSTDIKKKNATLVSKFGKNSSDTGSPEVQVALLTGRITHLTNHLQTHKKDELSRRGLLSMVGQRKRLLTYLKTHYETRYLKIIEALNLRK